MGQIIIYGAGNIGKQYFQFFKSQHMVHMIYAFCDKNYAQIKKVQNVEVLSYAELGKKGIPFGVGWHTQKRLWNF